MKQKEKPTQEIKFRDLNELNLKEFYRVLNKAITTNNVQSIYELSKTFTRYLFKSLNN